MSTGMDEEPANTHQNLQGTRGEQRLQAHLQDLQRLYAIDVAVGHPRVEWTCLKHMQHFKIWHEKFTPARHTAKAFRQVVDFVDSFYENRPFLHGKRVIFDSGCGLGMSTAHLAQKHPNMPIIGIDRSISRLSKHHTSEGGEQQDTGFYRKIASNAILVRADLGAFWMMALDTSDWIVHSHYILYPNPYPKSKHLQRRWHGHSVFPAVLVLGGDLIVRSNWEVYCNEMATAMNAIVHGASRTCHLPEALEQLGQSEYDDVGFKKQKVQVKRICPDPAMTHFEQKYVDAGVLLYELSVPLGQRSLQDRFRFLQKSFNIE